MPFKSEKQRRFMFLRHPTIAKEWARKYGSKPQSQYREAAKRRLRKRQKR